MNEENKTISPDPSDLDKRVVASGRGRSKHTIIVGIILLCLLGGGVWLVALRPDPVISRFVLIVDDGAAMNDSFGETTKAKSIKNALIAELSDDQGDKSFSLRIAGRVATNESSHAPAVPFARRNQQAVTDALADAAAVAKGTIEQEVTGAVSDLTIGAGASGSKKTLLLFVGSDEVCQQDTYRAISAMVRNENDVINWKLIGVGLDQDCRVRVKELRGWLDLAFAHNQRELQWFTHDGLIGNSFRNLPPEIWFEAVDTEVEILVGETFVAGIKGWDPNGSDLVFDIVDPPENVHLRAKGPNLAEFVWLPTDDQVGEYVIAVTGFDGESATAAVLHLSVKSPPEKKSVNRPPSLDAGKEQYSYSVHVGETVSFTLTGHDPDGTVPTISLSEPPSGTNLQENGTGAALFTWTPISEQVGTHLLTFTAADHEFTIPRNIAVTVKEQFHQVNFDYPGLVVFDLDSHELSETGKKRMLNFLAKLKGTQKILGITITGHTCSLGSEKYNLKLGRERAEVVGAFLEEAGIAPELIRVESMGEKFPLADNATPEGREQNRRVHCVGDVIR